MYINRLCEEIVLLIKIYFLKVKVEGQDFEIAETVDSSSEMAEQFLKHYGFYFIPRGRGFSDLED